MNKKKVFSYLFIGLLTVGATGTVTSCKDYDDDINNLQGQIKANADKIAEIEKLIKGGSVITNVAQSETGVTVTLSDGKSFNLTNGKDGAQGIQGEPGKPGTAWTIGEDGYWYCDGKPTKYLARGRETNHRHPRRSGESRAKPHSLRWLYSLAHHEGAFLSRAVLSFPESPRLHERQHQWRACRAKLWRHQPGAARQRGLRVLLSPSRAQAPHAKFHSKVKARRRGSDYQEVRCWRG